MIWQIHQNFLRAIKFLLYSNSKSLILDSRITLIATVNPLDSWSHQCDLELWRAPRWWGQWVITVISVSTECKVSLNICTLLSRPIINSIINLVLAVSSYSHVARPYFHAGVLSLTLTSTSHGGTFTESDNVLWAK